MDRRTAPETEPDFRLLFESAPALYLVLRPDLRIVAVSDSYLAATMTRRPEILGRGLFDVFPDNPDDPAATGTSNLRASLDRVLSQGIADTMAVQKYDVRRPEGGFEQRWWSPINSPIRGPDGSIAFIIHRVEDVTEFVRLKQLETERDAAADRLRTETERMEAEIYRRAQEVQSANARLRTLNADLEREAAEHRRTEESRRIAQLEAESSSRAKSEFLSGMSHELRTPLNAILGFAQLLEFEPLDEGCRESTAQILKAGRHLLKLVDELLDIARIESGRMDVSLEPVELAPPSSTPASSSPGPTPTKERSPSAAPMSPPTCGSPPTCSASAR